MKVRFADMHDLKQIAICHRRSFPDSFTSRLGVAYLTKMYQWYLSESFTFLIILMQEERVVGYAGGLLKDENSTRGSASGMTQYSFSAACRALLSRPWLFFHPELLKRYKFVLRNIRMKLKGNPQARSGAPLRSAGLVVIAVDPDHQGKGFATVLLQKFEEISSQRGFSVLQLSVKASNIPAIKVYERNGWMTKGTGNQDLVMEKIVQPASTEK